MTITEFLLARIAEDEAAARYATTRDEVGDADWAGWWLGHQQHYARHDPARVLAECEATRRIIEQAWKLEFEIDGEWGSGRSIEEMQADGVCPGIIAALASVYADHPDFRAEWRTA